MPSHLPIDLTAAGRLSRPSLSIGRRLTARAALTAVQPSKGPAAVRVCPRTERLTDSSRDSNPSADARFRPHEPNPASPSVGALAAARRHRGGHLLSTWSQVRFLPGAHTASDLAFRLAHAAQACGTTLTAASPRKRSR